MLTYSIRAIKALTFLFRPYNDLDVYVEDTLCRNLYEVLISRILNGRAKVARIFQLGGKQQVLDECAIHQRDQTRKSLFLIDGDYDLILDVPPASLHKLYRLNVYCSENLILCATAVAELAYESMSNLTREEAYAKTFFLKWREEMERLLGGLFIVYAAAHILNPSIITCGHHVYQLCRHVDGHPRLDAEKVRSHRCRILRELETIEDRPLLARRLTLIRQHLRSRKLHCRHFASGKSYVLPLLHAQLKRSINFRGSLDTMKVQLSRFCCLTIDDGLTRAVLEAAKN